MMTPEEGKGGSMGTASPNATGWPEGDAIVEAMMERCNESEVMEVLKELQTRVGMMGIATRFLRDQGVDKARTFDPMLRNGREDLSEVGAKRAQLTLDVIQVTTDVQLVFGRMRQVRLDIEATCRNDDGSLEPDPSPEELRREDFLQRKK